MRLVYSLTIIYNVKFNIKTPAISDMDAWDNEKNCGNVSPRQVFLQLFRVLSNIHECYSNFMET